MAVLQYHCPFCQTVVQDDGSLSGRVVACPNCGQHFTLPAPMATPLPPQQPATVAPSQPAQSPFESTHDALLDLPHPPAGQEPRANRRVSFLSLIFQDWVCATAVLFFILNWAFAIFGGVFGYLPSEKYGEIEVDRSFFLAMILVAVLFTAGGGVVILWRVAPIVRVFRTGYLVKGMVQQLWRTKDGLEVELRYLFRNRIYQTTHELPFAAGSEKLRVGAIVELIVDPKNPRQTFIA